MEKKKLVLIFLFGFLLRFYGINWDSGFHLHPDERMLIMVAEQIHFFNQLNPHFFNYGSLPIYLLKGTAQLVDLFFSSHYYSNYEGLLYVGRSLSILFDLGTIFLIYKISHLLFFKVQGLKSKVDYLSSFFYAIMFFPIQNSHFFTVDLLFTFLSTLLVYNLLLYRKKYSYKYILFIAVVFSALFATKFTAIIFLPMALLVLIISNKFSLYSILHSLFFILSSLFFSFILMPYAFLDFSKFWADISPQLAMSKDPYIFPYTLQYVGTTPYLNYLKNIFLWGLGPIISILSLSGVLYCFINFAKKYKLQVFFLFYAFYFLSIGISTVKFMRYMFPMYPFFAIMAGFGLIKISKYVNIKISRLLIIGSIIWTLFFVNIYSQPNTRITTTEWILKNIPTGSRLAVEYWDDYLPIYGSKRYYFNELHLYDQPDNEIKWQRLNSQLRKSDYLIIASNRLYIPLQKLTDCKKYKLCYPKTAEYYRKLFKGEFGFKKLAEFSVKPGFQISNFKFQILDDSSDESFTVFDHPKVMIFKRI